MVEESLSHWKSKEMQNILLIMQMDNERIYLSTIVNEVGNKLIKNFSISLSHSPLKVLICTKEEIEFNTLFEQYLKSEIIQYLKSKENIHVNNNYGMKQVELFYVKKPNLLERIFR